MPSAIHRLKNVQESFPLPAGGPILTSCVLASPIRKASLLIPSLTPPNPHADAKGASLFVPESSRAFLSCPRTMHDEIRTGPPYGHALSIPHCREAQTKTTLSFQNLEAALPPGIPAGRRSNSRSSVRSFASLPFYEGEAPQAYACGGGDASPNNCCRNWRPLVQFRRRMDGPHGGIKDRFSRLGKNDRVRCGCNLNRAARG